MSVLLLFIRVFFIGICAIAMIMQTRMVLGMPMMPGLLDGFVFGGSLFGYHCAHPDWRQRALGWSFGTLGGLCFLFWANSMADILFAIVPMFFWLAYYGFRRPGNAGLRTVMLAKPLTVALAWAWVTVFLPVSFDLWFHALPMFMARSAFIFALALAYDLSDMAYDLRHGLNTLAIKLDTKGTFSLIYSGITTAALFVCIGFASGVYSISTAIALGISLIISVWWIRLLIKKDAWLPWHKVLIDALMLLQCGLVLLLR